MQSHIKHFVRGEDLNDPPPFPAPIEEAHVGHEVNRVRPWYAYYARYETSTRHRTESAAATELRRDGFREVSPEQLAALHRARGCPGY